MFRREEIAKKIEENKSLIWGIFLSTLILGHAISNIFLVVLLFLFSVTVWSRKKIRLNIVFLPILILFVWGVISVLWTTHLPSTLSGIEATLSFLALPLVISQYDNFTIKDIRKITNIFSFSLIIYFAICLCHSTLLFIGDRQFHHFFYHNLTQLFNNSAIYISLYVSICVLIKVNLSRKSMLDKIIIFALLIFLFVLSSKNLIISTFLLLGISLLLFKNNRKKLGKSVIISTSLLLLITTSFIIIDNPVKQRFLNESNLRINEIWNDQDFSDFEFNGSNLRIFQWRIAQEMIEHKQVGFLGLGLNNIDYLTDQYFHYYNVYQGYNPLNFHNQYLQTLGELGFLGLAILLFIILYSFFKALKHKNKFLFIITALFLLSFLTESYLCRQKGIMIFSVMFCILLSSRNELKKHLYIQL